MNHVKAGFGALITLLLGLGLFSACSNTFAPPVQPEESGQGGVTISIAGGQSNIRTLYPTAEFTKYTLDFSHTTSSHAQVPLNNGASSVVIDDLDNGEWTITAKGYVSVDVPGVGPQEFEAARGTKTITVSGGTAAPVTIDLDAEMGADNGYLSWDIDIPDDPGIQEARIWLIQLSDNTGTSLNLLDKQENKRQGIKDLPPGYYLVRLSVFNGYQRVGHTEVAAVYSNMETTANYTFTGADFVPAVKMSGTVNLTGTSGSDVQNINIIARNNSGLYMQSRSVMVDSGDGSYNWEIYTAAGETPSQTRFEVEVVYTGPTNSITINTGKTIDLGNSDVPGIDLGMVNVTPVTIGGTIHFTGIPQDLDYINIYGNSVNNGQGYKVSLGPLPAGQPTGPGP